jgi:hypothetical protein
MGMDMQQKAPQTGHFAIQSAKLTKNRQQIAKSAKFSLPTPKYIETGAMHLA